MTRGTVHLLIGPVGAGKTTYAWARVARSPMVLLDLDAWMVRLFGSDPRPPRDVVTWYLERRDRCRRLIWDLTLNAVDCAADVLLEIGLVGQQERTTFYEQVRAEGLALRVYLVDASRDVRRERVAQRNRLPGPFAQIVPPEFFERASDAWEPPSESERVDWGIVDV